MPAQQPRRGRPRQARRAAIACARSSDADRSGVRSPDGARAPRRNRGLPTRSSGAAVPLPAAPLPLARWVEVVAERRGRGAGRVEPRRLAAGRPGPADALRRPRGAARARPAGADAGAATPIATRRWTRPRPSLRPVQELAWEHDGLHLRLTGQGPWESRVDAIALVARGRRGGVAVRLARSCRLARRDGAPDGQRARGDGRRAAARRLPVRGLVRGRQPARGAGRHDGHRRAQRLGDAPRSCAGCCSSWRSRRSSSPTSSRATISSRGRAAS